MRTHACGELRAEHAGAEVVLCGWVAHRRDHGGVTFIDLRDREGVVQVVFHPDGRARGARGRAVAGRRRRGARHRRRPPAPRGHGATPRSTRARSRSPPAALEVLSESDTPPFPIEDRTEANEDLRLKYRYLDLRRPGDDRDAALRHRVIRDHPRVPGRRAASSRSRRRCSRRSTPGGRARLPRAARAVAPGTFYALPQSPQQLKQLLMVAGQDRYYQIVRCFRDEASRADRGFEFTQLDLEMSFVDEEDIYRADGAAVRAARPGGRTAWRSPTPFPRLTYEEVIERFGSDKPDLRYGMELADLDGVFAGTGFNAFASVLTSGGRIQGIAAPGGAQLSRKELDELVTETQGPRRGRPRVDGRRGERCALAGREAPVAPRRSPACSRPPARRRATWC